MAVRPYVKQSYVSPVQHDHASGHKHLQNALGLERLTKRSDAANDFSDVIDMLRLNATCSTAFWVASTTAFRPARHTLRLWPFQSPMQSPLDNCFPGMSRLHP